MEGQILTAVTGNDTIHWSKELTVIVVIDFTIIAVSVMLHLVGMALLYAKSNELSNQSIFLIHMTITSLVNLGTNTCAVYFKAYNIPFSKEFIIIFYIGYISYIVNLVLLTTDRLLMAIINVRYQEVVTKFKVLASLVLLWVIAIGYGLLMKYAKFALRSKTIEYATFSYNGFVVVYTAIAYVIIAIKVKQFAKDSRSDRYDKVTFNAFTIPFVIVCAFFIFNVIPAIIVYTGKVGKAHAQLLVIGLIGINCLSLFFDPIIYIFMQSAIREKLRRYVTRCFGKCTCDSTTPYVNLDVNAKEDSNSSSNHSELPVN